MRTRDLEKELARVMSKAKDLTHHRSNNSSSVAIAAIAGLAVGAALAILFAPEAGEETRRKIGETLKDNIDPIKDRMREGAQAAYDKTKDAFSNVKTYASERVDEVKDKASDAVVNASNKVADMAEKADNKIDNMKNAADNKVTGAVDKMADKAHQVVENLGNKAQNTTNKFDSDIKKS